MQEIVPLILSGGDPASVETLPNWKRVPWLEEKSTCLLNLEERPSPRMLSTHFRYDMMPPTFRKEKPKVNLQHNLRRFFSSCNCSWKCLLCLILNWKVGSTVCFNTGKGCTLKISRSLYHQCRSSMLWGTPKMCSHLPFTFTAWHPSWYNQARRANFSRSSSTEKVLVHVKCIVFDQLSEESATSHLTEVL